MTEHEKRIREALEAGPTDGKWHWHGAPVKGDPTGRVRFEVVTIGKTIARIYYSSYEGGPTNAGQDAAYIAACNPAAIRALLADLDAVRADAARYRWLRAQHEGVDELTYDAEGFPMPLEPTAAAYTVFRPGRDLCLEPVGCIPGELDAAIDAALKGATA